MATKKPVDVAVLNSVAAAAADVSLSGNKISLTNLSKEYNLDQIYNVAYAAYAAGTPSKKDIDFTACTLLANSQYRVAVIVPGKIAFHGGGQEANQLIPIREYVIYTGSVAPTASELRDLFLDRINSDLGADVSGVAVAGDILRLTLTNDLNQGDFNLEYPSGATTAVNTAFVAPSGTPEIVEALAPGESSAAAQYATYTVSFYEKRRHNGVSGGLVEFPEDIKFFINTVDADAAALIAEIDAIFDGSHTPVADYLGV